MLTLDEAARIHNDRADLDGEGISIGILEGSISDRARELIADLDVEILETSDLSQFSEATTMLHGREEKLVDAHVYKTCKTIRSRKPKAKIYLAVGHRGGMQAMAEKAPDIVSASIHLYRYNEIDIRRMAEKSFLLFAAGNSAEEGEQDVSKHDRYVTTVGALGIDELRRYYSSFGRGYVDIAALTEFQIDASTTYAGTSAATPLAATLVASFIEHHRRVLGYGPGIRAIRKWVEASAHDVGAPGWDLETGYGMLKLPRVLELEEVILHPALKTVERVKYREGEVVSREELVSYVEPYISDGRMRVAIRDVEMLGLTAYWDGSNKTVHIAR